MQVNILSLTTVLKIALFCVLPLTLSQLQMFLSVIFPRNCDGFVSMSYYCQG